MKKIPQNFVAFLGIAFLTIIIIAVLVGFNSPQNTSQKDEKIFILTQSKPAEPIMENDFVKIQDMAPNSAAFFYYPNSHDTKNRDAFETFLLIRLPEELGGNKNDITAYRAYSALGINSHCLSKYWSQEGRKRIEEPCHGDMIRPQDGILVQNTNPVKSGVLVAQPYLELAADKDGYIVVKEPVWEIKENGVVGIGRSMPQDVFKKAGIDAFENYIAKTGHTLEIPFEFSDGTIITPGLHDGEFIYRHPQDARIAHYVSVQFCNCKEIVSYQGRGSYVFQEWKMVDERMYTDEWTKETAGFDHSEVTFFKDGYEIVLSGQTLDKTLDLVFTNFYDWQNRSVLELVDEIRRK